jgi:hypothetical protein
MVSGESLSEYTLGIDYEHEHRPPRRTEHEHGEQPEPSDGPKTSIERFF